MTNTRVKRLLEEEYTIEATLPMMKYCNTVHVYVPRKLKAKFEGKKAYLLSKDGKYCIVTEDE